MKSKNEIKYQKYKELGLIHEEISIIMKIISINDKKVFWDPEPTIKAEDGKIIELIDYCSNYSTYPEEIGELRSLKKLTLLGREGHGLKVLPKSIFDLKSLEYLNLRENELKIIPDEIGGLKSLKIFDLGFNKIYDISHFINKLTSLEVLFLADNKLVTLPPSIGDLRSLQVLDLSSNRLTSLPKTISQLKSLQILDITHTKINNLPKDVEEIESLNVIWCIYDLSELKRNKLKENNILLSYFDYYNL